MNAKHLFAPNSDDSHTVFIAHSGTQRSMLQDLTPDEHTAMLEWCDQQPRSPGGSVDAMGWPGWEAVIDRRFKARLDAGSNQQDA
jgi:hypothetical protein